MHKSTGSNYIDCVKLLVDAKASVNLQDNVSIIIWLSINNVIWYLNIYFQDGCTALHIASFNNYTECIQLLLVHAGTDKNLVDRVSFYYV